VFRDKQLLVEEVVALFKKRVSHGFPRAKLVNGLTPSP